MDRVTVIEYMLHILQSKPGLFQASESNKQTKRIGKSLSVDENGICVPAAVHRTISNDKETERNGNITFAVAESMIGKLQPCVCMCVYTHMCVV